MLQGQKAALGTSFQLLNIEPAAGHRFSDGGDGGIRIGGHQDQIGPGLQGQHGRLPGAVAPGDRVHHQGIGHDQSSEAQLLAQQPGKHRLGEGCWPLLIKLWQQQVGGHHRGDSSSDRLLKRR